MSRKSKSTPINFVAKANTLRKPAKAMRKLSTEELIQIVAGTTKVGVQSTPPPAYPFCPHVTCWFASIVVNTEITIG